MRYRDLIRLIFVFNLFASPGFTFQYRIISPKTLKKKIQSPCSLVHFWASWCEICIKELPVLLPYFESKKGVESVVVDLSHGLAQEKFSKVWIQKIAPRSKTYRKGNAHDHDLVEAVSSKWNGGLPITLLFTKGRRRETWKGSVVPAELDRALLKYCNASR